MNQEKKVTFLFHYGTIFAYEFNLQYNYEVHQNIMIAYIFFFLRMALIDVTLNICKLLPQRQNMIIL